MDRLRITGIITGSSNEMVSKGTHHSLTVRVGDSITITKDRKWNNFEVNILRMSGDASSFILIAIDTQDGDSESLRNPSRNNSNIYSGRSGKRYPHATKRDAKIEAFFEDISRTIVDLITQEKDRLRAIIFGPGETKRRFYNFLTN